MFFTFPIQATDENWVHESICAAIVNSFQRIDAGDPSPTWPDILPLVHRPKLRRKTALRDRLQEFIAEAAILSKEYRDEFLLLLNQQNNIAQLLDGTGAIPSFRDELTPLLIKAGPVFNEGFSLLTKTGVRDSHYEIIWSHLESKTCPFCGLEAFDAPKLHREDEDHYLARSVYPLAAANLHNLVPMGGKCNALYKRNIDIINMGAVRNKVFNPYGGVSVELSLNSSNPFGVDLSPEWKVDFLPGGEQVLAWETLFSVRKRLIESVLKPYYDPWISELPDWFETCGVNRSATDLVVLGVLDKFVTYKTKHKEIGPGFLKHKVFEMIAFHCRGGNVTLIKMIRDALPAESLVA